MGGQDQSSKRAYKISADYLLRVHLTPRPSFFFFNDPATTEIYTLSLHDALPISRADARRPTRRRRPRAPSTRFGGPDRKSTRLNSSHVEISYAVFCLKKKKK